MSVGHHDRMNMLPFVTPIILFVRRHALLCVGTVAFIWGLGLHTEVMHALRLQRRVQQMHRSVMQLSAERDELVATVRQYQVTPFAHEKTAREWLQLGRPDEIVYRV